MTPDIRPAADSVVIPRRFRGPPDSANGGYACGVLGCRVHGPARVRITEPPPLDTPLGVRAREGGGVELERAGRIIGYAQPAAYDANVPAPLDFDVAAAASRNFVWQRGHPFATCFVCGPDREEGDGLRIFPGAVPERKVVAAAWVPGASVCDASGAVQVEIVWAALDCPSWFGIFAFEPDAQYALLGELTVRIVERPRQDDRCVVLGWTRGRDGRKLHGGTAIHDADGRLLASSAATWIELRSAARPNLAERSRD